MNNAEQQFLNELDNKFWKAADKLRANMDAANYKHVVLGLIFLKYVSDAFEARQQELITLFRDIGNRAIETAQVIEELIQMAKAFQEAMARDDALGLNPDEIAFYDALAENESAVRELGDETLRKLAIEVTRQLRKSTTVDWQVRESVRARLRILVRQTLRKYKYPPDKTAGAVELILKQAEVVSNSWTS